MLFVYKFFSCLAAAVRSENARYLIGVEVERHVVHGRSTRPQTCEHLRVKLSHFSTFKYSNMNRSLLIVDSTLVSRERTTVLWRPLGSAWK